ncbi:TPA: hypothetical protein NIB27_005846 [Pseudomonas aeruginosa]|uniref:hypothetical protein n=1 Tax=Pseudomonas aeruginosa TaxID=287 RepID=UPI00053F24D8|nr:hypothetical protein [Pseudomonas aeruginosa]EKV6516379.1 hypothetical protein [Pseudomonas aeruginosa]EKW5131438.1 hypothetical protein [Pseudomonas aeruginosa]ELE6507036.1 hypothetical protein [Pseudomonas aeruginosa]MBM2500537.1 hypothetical protein [Pseudomonas aeruginosa]MCS7591134.1 hypothetical protein [Pseudomonas aeruginosa]
MAIDPSIPLQASAGGAQNPLAMLSAAMQLRGANLNQSALNQQIQANQAASAAYQQATDPTTGQIDYNKLTALLANSPAAYNLPQIQAQIAQQKNAQLESQSKQFELARKQVNWLKGGLGSLLNNPGVSGADVMKLAAGGIAQGFLTPEQAAEELRSMPSDPQQLQGWLRNLYVQSLDSDAQLQAIQPQFQTIDTGSAIGLVNTNPLAGGQQVGQVAASFQKGLSPETATTPTEIFNPQTGAPELVTRAQFAGMAGGAPSGRYPGTPGINPMGGGVQAAPGIGQTAGAEVAARGAAERFNNLASDAGNVRNTVQGYDAALGALENLGRSGPAVDKTMLISSTLESLGLPSDKDANANWQSLNKYLQNAGASAAAQAGYGGTDAGRAVFGEGQPSAKSMNPEALREAIQYVKAQNLGVLAKQGAAQRFIDQNGGDYTKYSQFETRWNKTYNPDAMFYMSLPPEQQTGYIKGLSADKRKKLAESIQKMDMLGAF